MKKGFVRACSLLLALFVMLSTSALATGGTRLFDSAGLLSDEQRTEIAKRIDTLQTEREIDILIVTIDEGTGDKTIAEFADSFYDDGGYGVGDSDDGLLLLIDMSESEMYISTTGKAADTLNTATLDAILDGIADLMADGDYAGAFSLFLDRIEKHLPVMVTPTPLPDSGSEAGEEIPAQPDNSAEEVPDNERSELNKALRRLIIPGIVFLLIIFVNIGTYSSAGIPVQYQYKREGKLELTGAEDEKTNEEISSKIVGNSRSSGTRVVAEGNDQYDNHRDERDNRDREHYKRERDKREREAREREETRRRAYSSSGNESSYGSSSSTSSSSERSRGGCGRSFGNDGSGSGRKF